MVTAKAARRATSAPIRMRKLQTGYVRNYALLILIGALVALLAALAVTI